MRSKLWIISLIVGSIVLAASWGNAQIPRTINYQGYLTDAAGTPVDGAVAITFALYDSLSGGTALWTETHPAVVVQKGVYSVILGESTPLDTLAFDIQYYLELTIGGQPLTPRTPLTSVPYTLRAAGMDEITVKDGHVGVGKTDPDPSAKMEIAGALKVDGNTAIAGNLVLTGRQIIGGSDGALQIYANTTAQNSRAWIELWGNHATRAGELALAGTYVDLRSGSTTAGTGNIGLRLTADGNVGIGTTAPAYKLTVNGTVRASSVITDGGTWPDRVFAEGYDLMPLADVAAYIRRHKHLPDVPTQADVAEQGVDVGAMQATLLQKIEELTLHVIALNEENSRLKARLSALEQRQE